MTWMREHRPLVGLIIKSFNRYAGLYSKSFNFGSDTPVSLAEIQTMETILEEEGISMAGLSRKLGVTRGAVTKGIRKLERKGLIARYQVPENRKMFFLQVTPEGREVYSRYVEFVTEHLFGDIFRMLDESGPEGSAFIEGFFRRVNGFYDVME